MLTNLSTPRLCANKWKVKSKWRSEESWDPGVCVCEREEQEKTVTFLVTPLFSIIEEWFVFARESHFFKQLYQSQSNFLM